MAESKLSFKISAIDDTKTAFNSSKKSLEEYQKLIEKSMKSGKKLPGPFQKLQQEIKLGNRQLQKLNNSQSRFSKTVESSADVLGSVNREDVTLMRKMTEKGKQLQRGTIPGMQGASGTGGTGVGQNALSSQSQSMKVQKFEVDVLSVKSMKKDSAKLLGREESMRGGPGAMTAPGKWKSKANENMDEAISEGIKDIGQGVGLAIGGAIAALGVAYQVAATRASSFTQGAKQQVGGIQRLGFGLSDRAGLKTAGGFASGFRGTNRATGQDVYMTGQDYTSMLGGFAGEAGSGNRGRITNLAYQKGASGVTLPQMLQAYGINAGQAGQQAGLLQRFGGRGETGVGGYTSAAQMAENVGLGGARIDEFMSALQEAVTAGVMSGSQRTNKDLTGALGTLMNTSDERLKAMAPGILAQTTQTMNQAAMLTGGAGTGQMYQAVMFGRQERGQSTDTRSIAKQLASGNWLDNMQDALAFSQARGGTDAFSQELQFSKMMGLNISDPDTIRDLMDAIQEGTVKTKKGLDEFVNKRLKETGQQIEKTAKQDYLESINSMSKANSDAASVVNTLREAMQVMINTVYETNRSLAGRFLGKDAIPAMGPLQPVENDMDN